VEILQKTEGVNSKIRQFKKLKRKLAAMERQGLEIDVNEYTKLIGLDDWLSTNTSFWHRNYDTTTNN
jgi:cell fate (sporulation/competence/biofilm development) regulator YlbF (YheA/YmcA/DUF963 family)